MKLFTRISVLCGLVVALALSVLVSCTRNLGMPVDPMGNASTPTTVNTFTNTPTATGFTATFTNTLTATPTYTTSSTATNTPTATCTNTCVGGVCNTSTVTNTCTATNTYTPTNTATNTCTSTVTQTATNTTASTPTTNYDWDDFNESPWVQPPPTYLYNNGTYEQSATDTIKYNVTNTLNGSAGAFEDDIVFNAAGPLEELAIDNAIPSYGGQVNLQNAFGGNNPGSVSFWVYANNPVLINKVYIGNPSYTNLTNTPPQATISAGVWTNVVVAIPSTPALTTTQLVTFDIIPPASVVTWPYDANVLIDDIYFYQ